MTARHASRFYPDTKPINPRWDWTDEASPALMDPTRNPRHRLPLPPLGKHRAFDKWIASMTDQDGQQ